MREVRALHKVAWESVSSLCIYPADYLLKCCRLHAFWKIGQPLWWRKETDDDNRSTWNKPDVDAWKTY